MSYYGKNTYYSCGYFIFEEVMNYKENLVVKK